MAFWETLITYLENVGFYEFLLPWLLTFAVVYGLLFKANIFGDINKKVSGIIAFVVAFFVAWYSGPAIANYFGTLFMGSSIVLAVIIVGILFGMLLALGEPKQLKGKSLWTAVILAVVLFLIAAGKELRIGFSGQTWSAIIILIIIVGLAAWIVSGPEAGEGAGKQGE